MKQFEIWWAELPQPVGRRPVLVLTRTTALRYLSRIVIAEITTRVRGLATEVPLGKGEGLPSACAVNMDSVHVVALRALTERVGALARERHAEVKRALGQALDWPELTGA